MKKIQEVVKEYLEAEGISCAELARKCGWSQSKVTAFIYGYQKLNSADYGELCNALGVSYSLFYNRAKGIYQR